MCIGVPSLVKEVNGEMAVVEAYGELSTVSLILMNEEVKVGDYLLIQVGNFAVEIIEPERARQALEYIQELAQEMQHDESRIR